jgi:hypothetical protein
VYPYLGGTRCTRILGAQGVTRILGAQGVSVSWGHKVYPYLGGTRCTRILGTEQVAESHGYRLLLLMFGNRNTTSLIDGADECISEFFFCFFSRMYFSNTELTSLSCPLNAVFHVLCGTVTQDAGTPSHLLLQIFNISIISIAVVEHVPLTQGYRKESLFPRPAGTGVRTRAPVVAGSSASRSAIHYDDVSMVPVQTPGAPS